MTCVERLEQATNILNLICVVCAHHDSTPLQKGEEKQQIKRNLVLFMMIRKAAQPFDSNFLVCQHISSAAFII
jgi:hypothetical protein